MDWNTRMLFGFTGVKTLINGTLQTKQLYWIHKIVNGLKILSVYLLLFRSGAVLQYFMMATKLPKFRRVLKAT